MEELQEKLKKLDILDELNKKVTTIQNTLDKLVDVEKDVEELKTKLADQDDKIKLLEKRLENAENQSRRDNLIFYNIPERPMENWDDCENRIVELCEWLGVALRKEDIIRAHRLGRGQAPRPIIAKFAHWKKKEEILANKWKLAGEQIGISEDFSRRVREERSILVEEAKKYRAAGQIAEIRFNKMIVGKKIFVVNEENKVICIRTKEVKTGSGAAGSESVPTQHDGNAQLVTHQEETVLRQGDRSGYDSDGGSVRPERRWASSAARYKTQTDAMGVSSGKDKRKASPLEKQINKKPGSNNAGRAKHTGATIKDMWAKFGYGGSSGTGFGEKSANGKDPWSSEVDEMDSQEKNV